LDLARAFLEPLKHKYSQISYADLWTFAGVVAIKAMGGPSVPWSPGRRDVSIHDVVKTVSISSASNDGQTKVGSRCAVVPPNGRLPDAAQGATHIREVFSRMGFSDREMVALIGAHTIGRCHRDRSGYDGPWTLTPLRFSNQFFVQLLNAKWVKKQWDGPEQFVDAKTGQLMMLPADMALLDDPIFKQYVELYASDKEVFFQDFAAAFGKLLALGAKSSSTRLPSNL